MSSDYKWEMQLLAEEIAEQDGLDYDALSVVEQCAYFQRGSDLWVENMRDAADVLRKAKREGT